MEDDPHKRPGQVATLGVKVRRGEERGARRE